MYNLKRTGFKRNLTDIFTSYRRVNPATAPQPPNHDTGPNPVMAISDDVNIKLSTLDRKITELSELYSARSKPTFDNSEQEYCDQRIRQITNEIGQRISTVNSEIKTTITDTNPQVVSLIVNLQQCHRMRLAQLVQRFRSLQASRRPASHSRDNAPDPMNDMFADFHPQVSPEQAALLQRQEEENQQNEELNQMVSMMNELNSLFRDVSLLVVQQGTILDRIDTKIELSLQNVQKGTSELEKANDYQKSKGFYCYIGTVTVLIILCFVIVILRK